MVELTPSKETYVKEIYLLSRKMGSTRISDIAESIGVAKSSASLAIKELEEKGLAKKDRFRRVLLTDEGNEQASMIVNKYDIIYKFLTEVLCVSTEVAERDACELEHILSIHTVCAFCGATSRKKLIDTK